MALSERLFAAGMEQLSGSVGQIRADANDRLDHLEACLSHTVKATRFNTDALDHLLEMMDAAADRRARDQVEYQNRATQADRKISRLEESLARLEMNRSNANAERGLHAIEQVLNDAGEWFKRNEPVAQFGAAIHALSHRLKTLEQHHRNLLGESRAKPGAEQPTVEPPAELQAPPFVEPPDLHLEAPAQSHSVEAATALDFEEIFRAPDAGKENFLSHVRRTARAMAQRPRPRALFPVLVGLVVLLALATGLVFSGRMQERALGRPTAGLHALDGATANLPDALKFLTQAAKKGQAVAQYRLGTLYERGQGVPADPVKAAHWYALAANQGNRKAMHNLAVFYAGGAAGKKNMAEAARWFAKAAMLGLLDSQFNLALLYERGDGVPQSLVDAFKWYSIAAAAGDTESRSRINVLQTQLSNADRASASKAAATFHAAPLDHATNVPPDEKRI